MWTLDRLGVVGVQVLVVMDQLDLQREAQSVSGDGTEDVCNRRGTKTVHPSASALIDLP